ncbi:hypothetical protein B0H10DRAFT_1805367, partial [Mycena sp. CBHHK59/15]
FGPMLIGVLLNTTLYGVPLTPFFSSHFQALYLLIAESVNIVLDIGLIYEPLIFRYGIELCIVLCAQNPESSSLATTKALEVSPLRDVFLAWRVKILTESYFFPILIGLLSIISLGGGLSVTIMVTLHPEYADFGNFRPFVITWLSSSAACDVILSVALIYSLYTRKTGASPTDRYVDRIIRLTVQTGSITAVTALLDLTVFLFRPVSKFTHHSNFIWDFPLSKLYTNALLSTQVSSVYPSFIAQLSNTG